MPAVSREGDSLTTGHGCVSTTVLDTPDQNTVFANGILVARIDDPTVSHPFPPTCSNHVSTVKQGSFTVFAAGKKIARVGDKADAGKITSGSPNVFAGSGFDSKTGPTAILDVAHNENDEEATFDATNAIELFTALPRSDKEKLRLNVLPIGTSVAKNGGEPGLPQETGDSSVQPSTFTGTPNINCAGVESVVTAAAGDLDTIEAIQLSTNFTVKQLTRDTDQTISTGLGVHFEHPLSELPVGSPYLTIEEIVCNLKLLALNVCEPLFQRFPTYIITSTWRPFKSGTSNSSQHPKGQAIDIQWPDITKSDYFDRAKIVKDLIPYDQFLLEYKTDGSGLPWFHISFTNGQNRQQVLTLLNHRVHGQGLIKLA